METGKQECLAPFNAGSTGSAVDLASFVAGPSGCEIDAELGSTSCDCGFVEVDEGADESDVGVGASLHRGVHRLHEVLATIWVDGMVSGMGCDYDPCCALAFRKAGRNREHDGVSEGNDCLLHRGFLIVAFRDGP